VGGLLGGFDGGEDVGLEGALEGGLEETEVGGLDGAEEWQVGYDFSQWLALKQK